MILHSMHTNTINASCTIRNVKGKNLTRTKYSSVTPRMDGGKQLVITKLIVLVG